MLNMLEKKIMNFKILLVNLCKGDKYIEQVYTNVFRW